MIGETCGIIAGVGPKLWIGTAIFGIIVGGAIFLAVLIASTLGILIPIFFKKLGVDPAVTSGLR